MARNIEVLLHDISLQPGKSNVVADALSRMTMGNVSHVEEGKKGLVKCNSLK